jgi:hypothetical protein
MAYGLRPTVKYDSDTTWNIPIQKSKLIIYLTYQSLDQSLVQYIMPVVQSRTNKINEIQESSTE